MNTMENNITLGREKLISGINKVADVVKLTLGAAGSNAIFETDLPPFHIITNDGVSIVNEAWFEDPVENMGANILKEVAKRANDQSGDGTTTSIVLAQAIINSSKGHSDIELKNSLDECLPLILAHIDTQKRVLKPEEVKSVATISAESEELGEIIAKIYGEIGNDGIIELDNSRTYETYYTVKDGLSFPMAGIMSPYFANKENKVEYEKPNILVTDQHISIEADILPFCQKLQDAGENNLTIVCDKIDVGALTFLVNNHIAGKLNFCVIQAPTIMKEFFFEDIAKATGATLINAKSGYTIRTAEVKHLGTCGKLISSKDETRLIGVQDLKAHIESLQEGHITGIIAERIRRLNTKVAILYLSANSESELKYKNLKAEDAINATRLALKDGIVAGGGVCLINVANDMPDTIGGNILRTALRQPSQQILINALGEDGGCMTEDPKLVGNMNSGFDAKTKTIVDMFEAGIIDPASVVKNSVRTALSVASTVLSTSFSIHKHKEPQQITNPFPMM